VVRVCHVLASVGEKGGLEKNVIELANAQAALGHAVSAVADETMRGHFDPAVGFVPHPMHRARLDPFNLAKLRGTLLALHPQVVHAHANKAAAMVRALRGRLGGVKRVATVQNVKRRSAAFRDYDAVITASAQVRDSLGGIPATVIWNSIDPPGEEVRRKARATDPPFLDGGEPVLCTVGRLVPAKGMDLLLKAMAEVEGFRLWLVGEGQQRGELEELIASLGLGERVWLAGHRDDAVGLMGCADGFVVASRHEGGPYTLVEALHMRVPCLSTRVGFAPEFLAARFLMEPNSVPELIRGLRSVLADREGWASGSRPAFELAAREATLEAMTGKVLEVYARVLG